MLYVSSGPDYGTVKNVSFTMSGDGTYTTGPVQLGTTAGTDYIAVDWTDPTTGATVNLEMSSPPTVQVYQDTTQPTVTIAPVASGPTTAPVDSIAIRFSKPVQGFALDSLLLTLNGNRVPLAGATLTSGDDEHWTLGNLAGLTTAGGSYELSFADDGAGITDDAIPVPNPLAIGSSAQVGWTNASGILQNGPGNDTYWIVLDSTALTPTDDVFINAPGLTADNTASIPPTYKIPVASLSQWLVTGAAGDHLIVDFSNGDPLPSGGLTFDGPSATSGDTLTIVGTTGDDAVTVTPTQIVVDNTAPINYSNVQYFLANLAGTSNSLIVDAANLTVPAASGLTSGTAVTITGDGSLNLNSNTVTVRDVSIVSGQVINGTLLNASVGDAALSDQQVTYLGGGLLGSSGLNYSGPGTGILFGANTYSGATSVSGGTVLVSPDSLPPGAPLTIGAGGTLIFGAAVKPAPVFSVTDAGGVYSVTDINGVDQPTSYPATVLLAGVTSGTSGTGTTPAPALEGVSPTVTYYSGSGVSGSGSSTAPSAPGTYTVVASFPGSADYAAATSAPLTFTISRAIPTFTLADLGGTYIGQPYPAATVMISGVVPGVDTTPAASLQGVTPTLTYYGANIATAGEFTPGSSVPPTAAGSYVVEATFPGSTDYSPSVSSVPFTIAQATPTITLADPSGTYNGSPFRATALVAGVVGGVDTAPAASLEGVSPTLTYHVGNSASGTVSPTVPTVPGTYTVVAAFAGSNDYQAGQSSLTFVIGQATPTVVAFDAGGTYNAASFPATATVAGVVSGVDTTPSSSLEGAVPTFTYYSGSTPSGAGSATAPTAPGTYTVVASFASTYYADANSSPITFVIAYPTSISVSGPSSVTYSQVTLTATVQTNPASTQVPTGGSVNFYVDGSTTPLGTAPLIQGVATLRTSGLTASSQSHNVTAVYGGSGLFAGTTAPGSTAAGWSVTVSQAVPTIALTDASGIFNGSPLFAAATVAGVISGVDNIPASSLEGVSPLLTYSSARAPIGAGTYTVTASFPGSTDYAPAQKQITFTIGQATPTLAVTDAGGPAVSVSGVYVYPYAATVTIAGVVNGFDSVPAASLEGVKPSVTYYVGSMVSGTGSTTAHAARARIRLWPRFPEARIISPCKVARLPLRSRES